MDTKKSAGEPSSPAVCSACASEKARADQMGINCRWLIDRLDRVCHALAPVYVGSWQDRANKAVEAAEAMTQNAEVSDRSERFAAPSGSHSESP